MATSALQLRLDAQAAYEDILRDEFRLYPEPTKLYKHHFESSPFRELYKRRRALLKDEFWPMLYAASCLPRHFIRDPMRWRARGHSVPVLLWSLVRHLYCRYPMPDFWLAEWLRDPDDCSMSRLRAFADIAQGRSTYDLARRGQLGFPLSRKESHLLGSVYGVRGLGEAARMAQVLARGGTHKLGRLIARCAWGEWPGTEKRERRRADAITWMCLQPGLTARDVDFVARATDSFPELTLSGRTLASVREYVGDREFQHVPVARVEPRGRYATPPPPKSWAASEYAPMTFARGRKRNTVIRELTTLQAVHHEGARLSHCVASYATDAAFGRCTLWSLRTAGVSLLTIEVRAGAVRQVRGKFNRAPTDSELKLIHRWAKHNRLRIADY